ncbi:MAG: hypothetical protein HKN09_13705 [Saprospiraceae bacterium]|nr:hypothetical protein [Saprospiraceae bacterium]
MNSISSYLFILPVLILANNRATSQQFYYGADMSYVNEMEDCGVVYHENNEVKDPYRTFSDYGCNLVRLRLWHTPSWYDGLNHGQRYSDLADVKKSIRRAKNNNMQVLLDFHLSDNWADPGKQLVPSAWLDVVDDVDILKDSLYNYIYKTLSDLQEEDLLPEMVQIGNETNKGILLSPEDNQGWTLDWNRNATLFNTGIKAVRDLDASIQIMLHVAGPESTEWLIEAFHNNGVTDFDMIGISYYWGWHAPATMEDVGALIDLLRSRYSEKEVMVVETAYLWTTAWNDNAGNIAATTHPEYPPTPSGQLKWMQDLANTIKAHGGNGLVYWEPCWQSSSCWTQWGEGSHGEHLTFYDFEDKLIVPGGIEWMLDGVNAAKSSKYDKDLILDYTLIDNQIKITNPNVEPLKYTLADTTGRTLNKGKLVTGMNSIALDHINGICFLLVEDNNGRFSSIKLLAFK